MGYIKDIRTKHTAAGIFIGKRKKARICIGEEFFLQLCNISDFSPFPSFFVQLGRIAVYVLNYTLKISVGSDMSRPKRTGK